MPYYLLPTLWAYTQVFSTMLVLKLFMKNLKKEQIKKSIYWLPPFLPPYACLFVDRMENDFFDSEIVKSWLWLRYIVDIFFIWTEGQDKLEEFLYRLNNFHPNVKFAHEKSNSSVNFLDVNVSIVDNKLETDLFCKLTDCHQFLHFNSAHPFHNKKSIV